MARGLTIFLVLVAAWLLWSGPYSKDPLIFTLGMVSCALVAWLVVRMDRQVEALPGQPELPTFGVLLRLPRYLLFLFLQTARSNIRVTRLILDPAMPMEPHLLRARASQKTAWAQVAYANSITLTPGTLTLDLRDGELLVHALGSISASSIIDNEIDREVTRLEGLS